MNARLVTIISILSGYAPQLIIQDPTNYRFKRWVKKGEAILALNPSYISEEKILITRTKDARERGFRVGSYIDEVLVDIPPGTELFMILDKK